MDEQLKALRKSVKPDASKSQAKRYNNKNRSNKRAKKRASIIIIQRFWRAALSRASTRPSAVASTVSAKDDKAAATRSSHCVGIITCTAYVKIIVKQYGHWIEGGSLSKPWGDYLLGNAATNGTDATRYSSLDESNWLRQENCLVCNPNSLTVGAVVATTSARDFMAHLPV